MENFFLHPLTPCFLALSRVWRIVFFAQRSCSRTVADLSLAPPAKDFGRSVESGVMRVT